MGDLLGLLIAVLVLTVVTAVALVSGSGARRTPRAPGATSTRVGPPRPGVDYAPGAGDDAEVPRDTPLRTVDVVDLPDGAISGPVLQAMRAAERGQGTA